MNTASKLLCAIILGAFMAWTIPLLVVDGVPKALLTSLVSLVAFLLIAELAFRQVYKWRTGRLPERFERIPMDELHVEPHPYLPYVYRRDFAPAQDLRRDTFIQSPIHGDRFRFPRPSFNNFRLKREPVTAPNITVPKPAGRLRVLCLGASTTANSVEDLGQTYSYPMELEKALRLRHGTEDIEVVNGGMGGRTTAEILIHFLLELVDMQPDIVVIYHAYNDLGPSLTPNFHNDYSHARKNIGEVYHLYKLRALFPDLPSALYTYLLNTFFPGELSTSLLEAISVGKPNIEGQFQGLPIYRRNLGHLIDLCRANNIDVLCSSYCQYLYPEVANSPVHLKYREGLLQENAAMQELAAGRNAAFVDTAFLMPTDPELFIDSVHFSPLGMARLAAILTDALTPLVEKRLRENNISA